MTKIEEARATFSGQLAEILFPYGTSQETEDRIRAAADVYSATLALAAHVDTCSEVKIRETPMTAGKGGMSVVEEICGVAGWLCDKAREAWPELT